MAESPCAPRRPLQLRGCPWTSASEMQSARPRPVLLNQCRRLTRVQVTLVLWRVEQRRDKGDRPTTAAGLQNALDLALVRFRIYKTEASGGHMWTRLIWWHSSYCGCPIHSNLGSGSPGPTNVEEAGVVHLGQGRVSNSGQSADHSPPPNPPAAPLCEPCYLCPRAGRYVSSAGGWPGGCTLSIELGVLLSSLGDPQGHANTLPYRPAAYAFFPSSLTKSQNLRGLCGFPGEGGPVLPAEALAVVAAPGVAGFHDQRSPCLRQHRPASLSAA